MSTEQMNTLMRDLDLACDGLGQPLSGRVRARIALAVEHPSEASWDDVHGFLLNRRTTLWQAVLVVDPGFGAVSGPVHATVNPAGQCPHPENDWDFVIESGTFDYVYQACGACGATRPVHDDDDRCETCLEGAFHDWQPDLERSYLHQVSGWSRTPSAQVLRQAIAFATH